jgi:sigma-E factor negative regulatory protein RseA
LICGPYEIQVPAAYAVVLLKQVHKSAREMTMSEQLRESLSALMDDEANELELERVLSRIGDDDDLRASWSRFNGAREALSGQSRSLSRCDISKQVSSALASEQASPSGRWQRMMRPVASFAVAASVAATVVIGGQQLAQLGAGDPYDGGRSVAAGVSPVGFVNSLGATPVQASYGTRSAVPALQPATRTAYAELARQRMTRYSQEHAEHAALNTPQGLIPFARVPRITE